MGYLSGLNLLFIGLKLGTIIDWSWGWVMLPLIISIALKAIIEIIENNT